MIHRRTVCKLLRSHIGQFLFLNYTHFICAQVSYHIWLIDQLLKHEFKKCACHVSHFGFTVSNKGKKSTHRTGWLDKERPQQTLTTPAYRKSLMTALKTILCYSEATYLH